MRAIVVGAGPRFARPTIDRTAGRRSRHADEIVRSRLAEVRRIIGNQDLKMKQVAMSCGFGSVSYMTTFLKKHLGVTPGQLRGGRS